MTQAQKCAVTHDHLASLSNSSALGCRCHETPFDGIVVVLSLARLAGLMKNI